MNIVKAKTIELRDYQEKIIDDIREQWRSGKKRVVAVLPTGSGKTALSTWMLAEAKERGNKCLFLVHRKELLDQTCSEFKRQGLLFGLIKSGYKLDTFPDINIAMIPTMASRINKEKPVPDADFVVIDECHMSRSATWTRVLEHYKGAYVLGLTATPRRLDGKGLGKLFQVIVEGPSVADLISRGHLSDFRYHASTIDIDTKSMREQMGDYHKDDVKEAMRQRRIVGNAVREYKEKCAGKQAIVFADCVENSINLRDEFLINGVDAEHADGKTKKDERDEIVERFRRGELTVLCNCNLFVEGFDVPQAQVAILMRPTKSLTRFLQSVGRVMRPFPGKPYAMIMDHVGDFRRHGLPDKVREWSLEDRKKKKRKGGGDGAIAPEDVQCGACQLISPIWKVRQNSGKCPECGVDIFIVRIEGELVELQRETEDMTVDQIRRRITFEKSELKKDKELYQDIDSRMIRNEDGALGMIKKQHRGLVESIKRRKAMIKALGVALDEKISERAEDNYYKNIPYKKRCEMVKSAETFAKAFSLAKIWGYKSGWVWHQRKGASGEQV